MQQHTCMRCGSNKSMAVPLVERSSSTLIIPLVLRVLRNPRSMFFKKPFETPLVAWVCGDCGSVDVFAKDPQGLWQAYCQSLRQNSSYD
jgi:hypothetical protein